MPCPMPVQAVPKADWAGASTALISLTLFYNSIFSYRDVKIRHMLWRAIDVFVHIQSRVFTIDEQHVLLVRGQLQEGGRQAVARRCVEIT